MGDIHGKGQKHEPAGTDGRGGTKRRHEGPAENRYRSRGPCALRVPLSRRCTSFIRPLPPPPPRWSPRVYDKVAKGEGRDFVWCCYGGTREGEGCAGRGEANECVCVCVYIETMTPLIFNARKRWYEGGGGKGREERREHPEHTHTHTHSSRRLFPFFSFFFDSCARAIRVVRYERWRQQHSDLLPLLTSYLADRERALTSKYTRTRDRRVGHRRRGRPRTAIFVRARHFKPPAACCYLAVTRIFKQISFSSYCFFFFLLFYKLLIEQKKNHLNNKF